ncbi:MAG: purine-binding chemotaxis protein CheW [Desulfamplus sp.]|nr:purine-binding chemotaxis protein CheW [Desulfamplus sp.]
MRDLFEKKSHKNSETRVDEVLAKLDRRRRNSGEEAPVEKVQELIQLVIFTMDDLWCAFPGSSVLEIIPWTNITPVPGCSSVIRGVINVRGTIESVLDLHVILSLEDENLSGRSRILIGHASGIRSGILVDRVEDIITIDKAILRPPLDKGSSHIKYCSGGETFYKDHYVNVLDMEKIFSDILGPDPAP